MKTAELIGPALDWAVAKCEGIFEQPSAGFSSEYVWSHTNPDSWRLEIFLPSTNWTRGGPIIERELLQLTPRFLAKGFCWECLIFENIFNDDDTDCFSTGPTPLIAAMRCYVASKLGTEIEIPKELE